MTVTIKIGHTLDVLREMPAESVHMVWTSPPYWGLRAYGTEPQVWGGDPVCTHDFKMRRYYTKTAAESSAEAFSAPGQANADRLRTARWRTDGFCRCGAWKGEHGLEPSLDLWLAHEVLVWRALRRVLRKDGTVWINVGDAYATAPNGRSAANQKAAGTDDRTMRDKPVSTISRTGKSANKGNDGADFYGPTRGTVWFKAKDRLLMPHRLAIALHEDGWWIRDEIVLHKLNPMPSSVKDRTCPAHEMLFMLTKRGKYFYDHVAVIEPCTYPPGAGEPFRAIRESRLKRSVWSQATEPYAGFTETVHQVRVEPDAGVDGMKRKASPDCPVHGSKDQQDSNAVYDEHGASTRSRIEHSDACLAQEQEGDYAQSALTLAQSSTEQSSDLQDQSCSTSVKLHSNETHRKAPVPATSPACTPSVQNLSRIGDRSIEPVSDEQHPGMVLSNSGEAGSVDDRTTETVNRSVGKQDYRASSGPPDSPLCTCEWYIEKIELSSHFATAPTAWVRQCILAGTSANGVCPTCGAPWRRKIAMPSGGSTGKSWHDHDAVVGQRKHAKRDYRPGTTTSWVPGCACADNVPIPATVLDCFGGAGTTGLVADALGRDCILIEIKPAYAAMARNRLAARLAWIDSPSADTAPGPLFATDAR